jgi:copper chaperone
MIELTLPDMTCGHCVKAVTAAVLRVDPGAKVEIDLATHRARIESTVSPERLGQVLRDDGYPPTPAG